MAVSCVWMHVLSNSTPDFQSRKPVLVSSWGLGGIETLLTVVPVFVAPSMREPPRKQTKWSCFGASRHELVRHGHVSNFAPIEDHVFISCVYSDIHLPLLVTFGYKFGGIHHLRREALLHEMTMYRCHCIIVHLRNICWSSVILQQDWQFLIPRDIHFLFDSAETTESKWPELVLHNSTYSLEVLFSMPRE